MKINIDGSRIYPFIIGWVCASIGYGHKSYWWFLVIPVCWALEFFDKKYFKKDKE